MARLGCIVAVLLVPLLLLASPGRAVPRVHGPNGHDAPTRAAHARDAVATRAATSSSPDWASPLVVAADYRTPVTTTTSTTTTTLPHPTAAARPLSTPTTTSPPRTTTTTAAPSTTTTSGNQETGQASWYQAPAGTCASPNLPFGTQVTVTDLANGRTTTCTVDDRQDPSTGRVLDLSESSFAQLADPSVGVIEVRLTW